MINRELTKREIELLHMIRPTTFQDIVETVRREVDDNRYKARKQLQILKNNGNGYNDKIGLLPFEGINEEII